MNSTWLTYLATKVPELEDMQCSSPTQNDFFRRAHLARRDDFFTSDISGQICETETAADNPLYNERQEYCVQIGQARLSIGTKLVPLTTLEPTLQNVRLVNTVDVMNGQETQGVFAYLGEDFGYVFPVDPSEDKSLFIADCARYTAKYKRRQEKRDEVERNWHPQRIIDDIVLPAVEAIKKGDCFDLEAAIQ